MADLTRVGLNNQKRRVSVSVSDLHSTEEHELYRLPQGSLVKNVMIYTKVPDTGSSATVDIFVGSVNIANEVNVDEAETVKQKDAYFFFPTGGLVTIHPGTNTPNGDGEVRVVVEYIELDKLSGEYTD